MQIRRRTSKRSQLGRNTLNAYAAGLLDGEGCVRWNNSPSIEVSNKHRGALRLLQEKWGGTIRDKGDEVFVWTVYGKKALKYLSNVAKYSVIKYPQIVALFRAVSSKGTVRQQHIDTLKRLKNVYTN